MGLRALCLLGLLGFISSAYQALSHYDEVAEAQSVPTAETPTTVQPKQGNDGENSLLPRPETSILSELEIRTNREYLASLPPLEPNHLKVVPVHIDAVSEDGSCRLDITYPQIKRLGSEVIEQKVNRHLQDVFLEPVLRENFVSDEFDVEHCATRLKRSQTNALKGMQGTRYRLQNHAVEWQYLARADYVVSLNASGVLSIRDDGYITDFSLAAQPTKHRAWTTVDLKTGEPYICEDLFKSDRASLAKLAQLTGRDAACEVPFVLARDGVVIAPKSSHRGFWQMHTISFVVLVQTDVIHPHGPLAGFLLPKQH